MKAGVFRPLIAVVTIAIGSSCGGPPRAGDVAALASELVIRDTAEYSNTLYGGRMGVLHRNGTPIDSVDLGFGVQAVPGGVLFLPLRSEHDDELGTMVYFTEHVLYDGTTRRPLSRFLPRFDAYFSSPNVIDSLLYYWGLQRDADYVYRVSAMRHDFPTQRTDSAFLFSEPLATDNPFHFQPPEKEEGRIRFESYEGTFWLDPAGFTLEHVAGPGRQRPPGRR